MTDPKTPRAFPYLVSLDVTGKCNMRCLHCYNRSGEARSDALTPDEVLRTVQRMTAALRPEQLCICGGEPLLFAGLWQVLECLRTVGISVSMVTNGMLLDRHTAQRLVDAGVRSVQISLDGAYAWQHDSLRGTDGAFDGAVRAIRALRDAGLTQTVVSMLPDRLNQHSLPEYFALCRSLGVDIVRMMPFLPMGRGRREGQALLLNEEEYFHLLRRFVALREQYALFLKAEWLDPIRSVRAMYTGETPPGYAMCIRSNGDVSADAYSSFIFGNVRRDSPEVIFRRMTDQVRRGDGVCRKIDSLHSIFDLEA